MAGSRPCTRAPVERSPVIARRSALTAVAAAGAGAAAVRAVADTRLRTERGNLSGRVALVAGGSRGLGLLVAAELARLGLRVVVCARDGEELDRAREQLAGDGLEVQTRVCDVADADAVHDLVADVQESMGPVEVLVTVAGIIQVGPVEATTLADFHASMDTTFWGGVHLSREVLPGMRERGRGHIATIASIGGRISPPHLLPYASAKFASVGYHEGLRAELTGTGVRVTTVFPGLMRTGSHVNAQFLGDRADEYSWFATAASLPGLAMDAQRAARRIVRGILLGRPEVQLPAYTHLATRVHGVLPATTMRVLGLVSTGLPSGDGPGRGWARYRRSGMLRRLTAPGARAAQRFNEHADGRKA